MRRDGDCQLMELGAFSGALLRPALVHRYVSTQQQQTRHTRHTAFLPHSAGLYTHTTQHQNRFRAGLRSKTSLKIFFANIFHEINTVYRQFLRAQHDVGDRCTWFIFYTHRESGRRLWPGGGGGGWVRARGGSRESTKMSAHYVMPRYTLSLGARQHFLPGNMIVAISSDLTTLRRELSNRAHEGDGGLKVHCITAYSAESYVKSRFRFSYSL